MKIPKVDFFLFFFPLKIGGYVIGGIGVFISVVLITLASIYVARILIIYNSLDQSDREALRNVIATLLVYFGLSIAYFLVLFASAVLLIIGTLLKKPRYLILHQILTVVYVISLLLMLFRFPFIALIPVMLFAILGIYFFICVQCLYSSFNDKTQSVNISEENNAH